MKKVIPLVLLLVALAAAAFVFVKKKVPHEPRAAELVPAETLFFVQFPDLVRTTVRYTDTPLWKIFQEPEMQQFLQKPRQQMPQWKMLDEEVQRWMRIAPREAFAAVTSIDGAVPTFVAGFAFSGFQKDAQAVIQDARALWRRNAPAGKADLVTYGKREIETFTDKDFTVAEVIADGWYLVADDLELLKKTLDRLDRQVDASATSLARTDFYRDVTAPLPKEPEAVMVAQLGTLVDRLIALLVASGQAVDANALAELKATKGLAAATKIDGEGWRDGIFLLRPGGAVEPALGRHALALSSPATLFYYAAALPAALEISEKTAPMLALITGWDTLNQALAAKQSTLADLPKAFGPEVGALLDWKPGEPSPTFLLALDVRDRAKAAGFAEVLAGSFGPAGIEKKEVGGAMLFSLPGEDVGATPALALTDKFVVVGLGASSVMQAGKDPGHLDATPAFATAVKSIGAPTAAFAYLDLKGLFERGYGVLKPLAAMSLAMSPEAGQYIDAGKLPAVETFSKHLSPIVYVQRKTDQGMLIESIGPLTLNQVAFAAGAAAIGAALPTLEGAMKGGSLLNPNQLLQGLNPPVLPPSPEPVEPPPAKIEAVPER